ncbi:S8 family serine peptidase [Pseudomonas sichuanensis]|uniref:S8 family serine peptidase n=1 Tax=Pseudomonas sichuanensis TaxID=2213015 RepID=A0ABV0DN83_9PSED
MNLALHFVYYRNFRFDGKIHVRCEGEDLDKVARVRYELHRVTAEGETSLTGVSARSYARTGSLADHGCPASLLTSARAGRYRITPRVILLEQVAQAMGHPVGPDGVIDLPALFIDIHEDELGRQILDKMPLDDTLRRGRRAVDQQVHEAQVDDPYGQALSPLPEVGPGERYPSLLIKFRDAGLEQLLQDMRPDADSVLSRQWPNLAAVIVLRPVLEPGELRDERLAALRPYCWMEQPASMTGDTYLALLKTFAALDCVESLQWAPAAPDLPDVLLGAAALLATLVTGGAVVLGNQAHENAQPTPDFEARQTYLDAPGPRWQGLNVRRAWAGQVTGKGARIHFSDGGLFPNHEDLRGNTGLKIVSSTPNSDPEHGTASAGVMLATRNGFGVTGIAHDSELYLYDNRADDGAGNSLTLKQLLRQVEPGDIVGINRQTASPRVLSTMLPSLHDWQWWDVMQSLSRRGAVVVNAAANGSSATLSDKGTVRGYGVDLAHWRHFDDHGDAGCILVGACQSWDGKPHQYSNFNYRHRMLNAWGDSVVTLGYGKLQDKSGHDRDYTDTYAGTSSATPLVAGALALIQSYAIEQHHIYLDGEQMHLLVSASGYQDATLPGSDVLPMGHRPDVHGALVLLDRLLGGGRFHSPRDEL